MVTPSTQYYSVEIFLICLQLEKGMVMCIDTNF